MKKRRKFGNKIYTYYGQFSNKKDAIESNKYYRSLGKHYLARIIRRQENGKTVYLIYRKTPRT